VTQKGEALSSLLQTVVDHTFLANPWPQVCGLHWFAVRTRPRHEKKVAQELEIKGIRAYVPLQSKLRQWSDRQQHVSLPLFPGYAFVYTGEAVSDRVSVLQTNGIVGFVGVRGLGVPIPDQQMQAIKAVVDSGVAVDHYPYLQEGKRVRIRSGSLAGVEGVLVAKNEDLSLVVSVELIQRSLAVRITGFHVEQV
jgi:transcription antitermination factor NusG